MPHVFQKGKLKIKLKAQNTRKIKNQNQKRITHVVISLYILMLGPLQHSPCRVSLHHVVVAASTRRNLTHHFRVLFDSLYSS